MGETRELAEWASGLRPENIPPDVARQAAYLVLDLLGCQVAGIRLPWSRNVLEALGPLAADGPATVVCQDRRIAVDAAAFLNSALGHSNESDDTHLKTPTHPGAVVIPAAVAVAEETGASGPELLTAIVAGYEAVIRISYAASPHLIASGHHPPPAVGPFGAAIAAAHLYGLPAGETVNALATAGSHAAGLLEYTQTGGSVKRMHCAIPAQAGVRSAILARHGLTGPPTILEGTRGFLEVFAHRYDRTWLTRDLGSRYLLPETAIKSYSCCHLIHHALDAYRALRDDHGFTPDDLARMTVYTRSEAVRKHVGVIKEPPDILGAQFSNSFSLSLMAHRGGCGFWDYFEADLNDPVLLDLARRVDTVVEDEREDSFPTGVRLEITMMDGSVLEHSVAHAHGEPENPLSEDEIEEKFLAMVTPVLGADRGQEVADLVRKGVENLPTVTALTDLLRGAE